VGDIVEDDRVREARRHANALDAHFCQDITSTHSHLPHLGIYWIRYRNWAERKEWQSLNPQRSFSDRFVIRQKINRN